MNKKNITQLHNYRWVGINHLGVRLQGEEQAQNSLLVSIKLKNLGIKPLKIKPKIDLFKFQRAKKIKANHIHDFSLQLATMLAANISLVTALDIISRGKNHHQLSELILNIKTQLESGTSLAIALAKYPQYFSEIYCKLIEVGEQSGQINELLTQIIHYQEKILLLKRTIKQALFYPIIVLTTALTLCSTLLIFIVPQFKNLFHGLGAQLPALTRYVIYISEFMHAYYWLIFIGLFVPILVIKLIKKFPKLWRKKLDYVLLTIPVIGKLKKEIIIARLARTLAITLGSGLPIAESLQISAATADNYIYHQGMLHVQEQVNRGRPLNDALKQTQLFSDQLTQMLAIGEESSNLTTMLIFLADAYDAKAQQTMSYLGKMIEPIIMLILGAFIGLLIMAMYLPIFKLGAVI